MLTRGGLAHPCRGELDRFDDLRVAGATAEIAGNRFADLVIGRGGVLAEEGVGGDDHAGRAIAALERVRLPEGILQEAEAASVVEETFYRDHLGAKIGRAHV